MDGVNWEQVEKVVITYLQTHTLAADPRAALLLGMAVGIAYLSGSLIIK